MADVDTPQAAPPSTSPAPPAPASALPRVSLPPPPSAPDLLCANAPEKKLYWDRSHYDSPDAQLRALTASSTVYVGNLAFSTRTSHLRHLFSALGPVRSAHMGLDRYRKTPCGFAFVEYEERADALRAVSYLTGSRLDGRPIRVELDAGFKPGRQYGRGTSGGQVRDDRRSTVDPARRKSGEGGGGGRRSGGGGMGSRWQSPQQAREGGGAGVEGHYGPAGGGGGGDGGPSAGDKRGRDDDGGGAEGEPAAKNPRFGDEGSDDGR